MGCRPRDAEPWLDPLTVVRDAVARSLAMRIDNDFINGDPATPGSFELKILNPATVYVPAAAVS